MRPWALSLLPLIAACTNEDAAEFVLQLEPRVPVNQDPFADNPVVKLLVTESGSTEVFDLGNLSSGSVEQNNLSELTEAYIGVVLEEDGGKPKEYDPSLLLAYGEAGPFDMATTDDNQTVDVLIAQYGEVGELDEFTDDSRFLAGAAVLPGGDVWVFGGCKGYSSGTAADDRIWKLTDLNEGDWKFEKMGKMPVADPDSDNDEAGRCGHSVNLVGDEEAPLILVAGGRDDSDILTENAWKTAFLYDPIAEEVVWDGYFGQKAASAERRSQHISVEMENGKILFMGGFDETGQLGIGTTFVIYDPIDETFSEAKDIELSPVGIAAASIGNDGVLVCGGAELIGGSSASPLDTCFVVSQTGEDIDEVDPLPTALYGSSMASLSNGRAIIAGGFDTETSNGDTDGVAIADAWIYEDGSWSKTGSLNDARALHRLITTPDGTVMAIGGVENGSVIFATGENELDCPERYDADSGQWIVADACGDAAAGFDPTVAVSPSGGFVLSGGWENGAGGTQGGTSYGILGIGPQGY